MQEPFSARKSPRASPIQPSRVMESVLAFAMTLAAKSDWYFSLEERTTHVYWVL